MERPSDEDTEETELEGAEEINIMASIFGEESDEDLFTQCPHYIISPLVLILFHVIISTPWGCWEWFGGQSS